MVNRRVVFVFLCCILSALCSLSVNANPAGKEGNESEAVATSASPPEKEITTDSDHPSNEAATGEVEFLDVKSDKAKEVATKILKDQVSTILALKKQKSGSIELSGKQWCAKGIHDGGEILLSEVQLDQNVYIEGCKNTTFIVPETLNHIAHLELKNCENVTVVFPTVISLVEVSESKHITINCYNNVRTIQLDKTKACKIYLASEFADRCSFTHTQCTDLELYRVLTTSDGTNTSQLLQIPDSKIMNRGKHISLDDEKNLRSRYSEYLDRRLERKKEPLSYEDFLISIPAYEQYITRLEHDPTGIYKTELSGDWYRNPKGELCVIRPHSKCLNEELLFIQRAMRNEKGKYMIAPKTKMLILEEHCEWVLVKRYKLGEKKTTVTTPEGTTKQIIVKDVLIKDANGDWIQITRDTNQLRDENGYIILPENNKYLTDDELIQLYTEKLNQKNSPTEEKE